MGSPWGGHAAVRHGGLRDPTRVRGAGAGRGRDGGVYVLPQKPYRRCPLRGRAWGTQRGVVGVPPPHPLVSPSRGDRSVPTASVHPPPHLRPTAPIGSLQPPTSTRVPFLPPRPAASTRCHSFPAPTVPHTRRLGTLHGVDTRGRGDPRTRTHGRSRCHIPRCPRAPLSQCSLPHLHAAFGHEWPRAPTGTDTQTHGHRRSHASPRPSLAVPPTHLDARGGTRAAVGTHAQSHAGRTHAHRCAALQVHNRPSHVRTRACPSPTRLLRSHARPTLPLPPLSRCRYRSRFLLTGEEEEEEEAEGGRPGPRPAWSHADTGGLRALLVSRSAPYGPNRTPAGTGGGRLRGRAAVLSRGEPGRDGGGVAKERGRGLKGWGLGVGPGGADRSGRSERGGVRARP